MTYKYEGNVDILIENINLNITYDEQTLMKVNRDAVGYLKGSTIDGKLLTFFDARLEVVNPLILQKMLDELARTGKINFPMNMEIRVRYLSIYYQFPLTFIAEAKPS